MSKYALFQFKEFSVNQEKCAMKIGTDAILLGAWATSSMENPKVLDIGCGSGLISLMLAQRFKDAEVTGIDIDEGAFEQSKENFMNSPWYNRLDAQIGDFRTAAFSSSFDLIVSNPPYFENALKAETKERNLARHTDSLSLHQLIEKVSKLLSRDGTFCMIYPIEALDEIISLAELHQLYISDLRIVHHNANKKAKRLLIALQKKAINNKIEGKPFYIRANHNNDYSEEYQNLTKSFHPFL
ncbi:methyltransferase [Flammeovirga sp. MY04]|uniref:tRNA1(Val) (adenine(37)-N6)-methyltransferase n=1 Tax=Flammeovirga sp. MY04 TaxID=1191459 RepID=UPI0008064112|nr:methyltransferase [Flammeovirga sp. MY04]ANQ47684.1 methyltransferase [Flammeovirga sp. MY04]